MRNPEKPRGWWRCKNTSRTDGDLDYPASSLASSSDKRAFSLSAFQATKPCDKRSSAGLLLGKISFWKKMYTHIIIHIQTYDHIYDYAIYIYTLYSIINCWTAFELLSGSFLCTVSPGFVVASASTLKPGLSGVRGTRRLLFLLWRLSTVQQTQPHMEMPQTTLEYHFPKLGKTKLWGTVFFQSPPAHKNYNV